MMTIESCRMRMEGGEYTLKGKAPCSGQGCLTSLSDCSERMPMVATAPPWTGQELGYLIVAEPLSFRPGESCGFRLVLTLYGFVLNQFRLNPDNIKLSEKILKKKINILSPIISTRNKKSGQVSLVVLSSIVRAGAWSL